MWPGWPPGHRSPRTLTRSMRAPASFPWTWTRPRPEATAGARFLRARGHCLPVQGSAVERVLLVKRDVEAEHVHRRLTQEAQRAALSVLLDECRDRARGDVPRGGDPVHLDGGVGRRDVRVEPRGRCGHRVRRDLRDLDVVERRDLLLALLDELDQGGVV